MPKDASQTEAPAAVIVPRGGTLATLFFKSFAGLGIGLLGMVILLIFVFAGLGVSSSGTVAGPFFVFTAIVMGLITSLVTNLLAVYAFGLIDREKYLGDARTMRHIASINMLIFVLLLPVYVISVAVSFQSTKTIFMIAALQLVIAAQASAYMLELSAAHNNRDRLLTVYSVTIGMLAALIINVAIFAITEFMTLQVDTNTGRATSSAATAILFSILPATWFCFGLVTSAVDMMYSWIYRIWGSDLLNDRND